MVLKPRHSFIAEDGTRHQCTVTRSELIDTPLQHEGPCLRERPDGPTSFARGTPKRTIIVEVNTDGKS